MRFFCKKNTLPKPNTPSEIELWSSIVANPEDSNLPGVSCLDDDLDQEIIMIKTQTPTGCQLTVIQHNDYKRISADFILCDEEVLFSYIVKNPQIPKWTLQNYADLCYLADRFPKYAETLGRFYYKHGNYCHKDGFLFGIFKTHHPDSPLFFQNPTNKPSFFSTFIF